MTRTSTADWPGTIGRRVDLSGRGVQRMCQTAHRTQREGSERAGVSGGQRVRYEDGPTVEVKVLIDAPIETVWELVTDINLPSRFSDEFRGAAWLDDDHGVGARFVGHNWHKAMGEWEPVSIVNR